MTRSIRFISAGAGSGKTYHLTDYLNNQLAAGRARPQGVIATTFTKKAANELLERVRHRLVDAGRIDESIAIDQALIGTVNSVCGRLLVRYAFAAGLSPKLEVIEQERAAVLFGQAMEQAVSLDKIRRMQQCAIRLSQEDWRVAVRSIVDMARANAIKPADLHRMAETSQEELLAFFPPPHPSGNELDERLHQTLLECRLFIDKSDDTTKATEKYLELVNGALRELKDNRLVWASWVKLSKQQPAKRCHFAAEEVQEAALAYASHPLLRNDLQTWISSVFDVAGRTMEIYSSFKAARGLMDFIDQEKQVLDLLDHDEVADSLSQELDLLMVDEFQDTSPIQLAVFLKLASLARQTVWVGDIKQAIYGFRGSDPELMNGVVRRLIESGVTIDILPKSWRSRPPLVHLVNQLFAPAFADILAKEQVVLEPAHEEQSSDAAVQWWTLNEKRQELRATALAEGVAALLAAPVMIVDKNDRQLRPLAAGDIAVLSRTHVKAATYAAALASRGIAVSLSRTGLLSTPEACLALACLRYLIDENDTLAATEIVALKEIAEPEKWLESRLQAIADNLPENRWGLEGSFTSKTLTVLEQQRRQLNVLSPVEALDLALHLGEVERTALAWGPDACRSARRLANIENLRTFAVQYEDECAKERSAGTAGGLLLWLRNLAIAKLDSCGVDANSSAVQVLTHHAAKGLEWPAVICADLDTDVRPGYWGHSIVSETDALDMDSPLANRRIRYWPKPFGQQAAGIEIYESIAHSDIGQQDLLTQQAEAIRLLYVSFTRARDLLILPLSAQAKSFPWLDLLGADWFKPAEGIMNLPDDSPIHVLHRHLQANDLQPPDQSPEPRYWFPPYQPATPKLPTYLPPSGCAPLADSFIQSTETIGQRLSLRGSADMQAVGDALHAIIAAGFFRADENDRAQMILETLQRFGVQDYLEPAEISMMIKGLQQWLNRRNPSCKVFPEWPIRHVQPNGQILNGWIDLAIRTKRGWLVIDHKTFPGAHEDMQERALKYSGQLAAYTRALQEATSIPVVQQCIHFVMAGKMVTIAQG